MKCPIDGTDLAMTDRQGIEIDYCPKCRGVWLDRGELDKLIERSADAPGEDRRSEYSRSDEHKHRDDRSHSTHRHKKKSLFGEIFDF